MWVRIRATEHHDEPSEHLFCESVEVRGVVARGLGCISRMGGGWQALLLAEVGNAALHVEGVTLGGNEVRIPVAGSLDPAPSLSTPLLSQVELHTDVGTLASEYGIEEDGWLTVAEDPEDEGAGSHAARAEKNLEIVRADIAVLQRYLKATACVGSPLTQGC